MGYSANAEAMCHYLMIEEEDKSPDVGWGKQTVQYAIENRSKVIKSLKSSIRLVYKSSLQETDVEDIYSELIEYLSKTRDYDIEIATNCSKENEGSSIIPLDAYVNKCGQYVVKRYISTAYARTKEIVKEPTIESEGKEVRILDIVPDPNTDTQFDNLCYDINTAMKVLEHKRYSFGSDIYLIMFIKLLGIKFKQNEKIRQVLSILGVSRKDLAEAERLAKKDSDFRYAINAMSLLDIDKVLDIMKGYVYGATGLVRTFSAAW